MKQEEINEKNWNGENGSNGKAVNGRQATRRIAREKRNDEVVSGRWNGGGGWWGVITGVLRQNGLIVRASWSAAILRRVLREYSLCVPRLNSYFLSLRFSPPVLVQHSFSLTLSKSFSLSRPRSQRTTARNAKPFHYQARSGSLLWRDYRD